MKDTISNMILLREVQAEKIAGMNETKFNPLKA